MTINLKELATVTAEYRNFSATPDEVTGEYPKIVDDKEIVKQVDETVVYGEVEKNLLDPDPAISFAGGFVYDHGVPELKAGNTGAVASYTVVSGTNTLVLYYVSSECTVDVYFRDADTLEEIEDMQTLKGAYNTSYTVPQPTIAGYTYDSTVNPNNSSTADQTTGTYKLTNEDVTVYYNAKTLNATIHYLDVTGLTANTDGAYPGGTSIRNVATDTGKIGEDIEYTAYTITGYINNKGSYSPSNYKFIDNGVENENDIYIYYTKKDLSFNVHYVLSSNHSVSVHAPTLEEGKFGDPYSVSPLTTIEGYDYDDILSGPSYPDYGLASGTFTDPTKDVWFTYKPSDTSVLVQYVEYDPDTADHIGQLLDDDTIEGKYGDVKTVSTPDITGTDGYVYTYHSISNPYQGTNTDPKAVNMEMGMDTDIIVFMTKTPVEIDVYFYELNHTTDLHTPETLEGYVGGSYEIELDELEDTQIDGFTHDKTDPNSVSGARIDFKYTDGHGDIIIYYTRVETTITVLHKYTDDNSYFGDDDDERDGDYEDTTFIEPETPKDGYDFVGYEVDTDEGDSLTAYNGSKINAEFGLEDYTVTLLYAPTSGKITVHYLEVGTAIGATALHEADTYSGNYEYEEISIDPETGEETTTTVPAEKFYGSQVDTPSVTGFHATGSVTLMPSRVIFPMIPIIPNLMKMPRVSSSGTQEIPLSFLWNM